MHFLRNHKLLSVFLIPRERLYVLKDIIEDTLIIEYLRKYKVQQRPQLMQIITQRRARQQQLKLRLIPPHRLRHHRLIILNLMSLIHHQHIPLNLRQPLKTANDTLVACHDNIEITVFYVGFVSEVALFLGC